MISRNVHRGFSLIEVLVAMGVLAIGLSASIPLVTYGLQRNAQSRLATGAQWAADQVLQRLQLEVSTDRNGAPGEGGLAPDEIWTSDFLPHGLGNNIGAVGACAPNELCCQPAGLPADGVAWNVAFPLRTQGNDYLVCYAVAAQPNVDSRGNLLQGVAGPGQLRSVQVKVLWQRSDGRVSFRTASGFVLGQAGI